MCATSWAFEPGSPADHLQQAVAVATDGRPIDLAVILGSGWSHLADAGQHLAEFPYQDWPCFPQQLIAGHAGRLVLLDLAGRLLLCFAGRCHCYQGFSAFDASLPVRLAASLGCSRLLLTCAAGGINPAYSPGDFVWVSDHLNLLGDNPLRGLSGDVFVDLSSLYNSALYDKMRASLAAHDLRLHTGVLAAMPGPSYETPAEVRMLAGLGADLVSMSMAHEAIMARYVGCDLVGLGLIANFAAGLAEAPLQHADVLECARKAEVKALVLFEQLVAAWCRV